MVRLRVARRREVRDPGGFQRHPGVESRDQRADGDKPFEETWLLRCKDFSADRGLDGGPAKLRDRYGPLHAPRGKKRTTRTNRSSTTASTGRGEALVLKPALGAGFEADRGACGTLKHRCPAAAFGCAGRKECCRAAPGRRAVRVDKHDRRLFTPPPGAAPPGSGDRRSAPDLQPGRQRLRRSTAGIRTAAVVRPPPLKLAACVQAAARLAPGLRRSAAATGYSPFVLKIERPCGPCGPAGGGGGSVRSDLQGVGRAAGRQKNGTAQTPPRYAG